MRNTNKWIVIFIVQFIIACTTQKKINKQADCPQCSVYVSSEKSELITRSVLEAQVGIICNCLCEKYNTNTPCNVASYKLKIISENLVTYYTEEASPYFTHETKGQFKKLVKGDMVVMYDIHIAYADKKDKVKSITFEII